MIHGLIFGITLLGLASLCLSLDRNAKQVFGTPLVGWFKTLARVAGWTTLLLAAALEIGLEGPSDGLIIYLGLLTIASALILLCLTYLPRHLLVSLGTLALINVFITLSVAFL